MFSKYIISLFYVIRLGMGQDEDNYDYKVDGRDWQGRCNIGKFQSPLDMSTSRAIKAKKVLPFAFVNYESTFFTYFLKEQILDLKMPKNGFAMILRGGMPGIYRLNSVRLHWPAEHILDGKVHAMEAQFEHIRHRPEVALEDENEKPKLGAVNPSIDVLIDAVETKASTDEIMDIRPFDLLPKNTRTFFRYNGSYTTPPCNETVSWNIFSDVSQTVSEEQMEALRTITFLVASHPIKHNNRIHQDPWGRVPYYIKAIKFRSAVSDEVVQAGSPPTDLLIGRQLQFFLLQFIHLYYWHC